ncbi:uncharacterized protein LOC128208293 isoform X2 [Mya arenaria]|nr:uncharacterized protein LOC128208293 isoform X2 [Mya arenaria]XP_052767795.1 uncharacterized protein LOC128208293 isoform X2 [Mya arenaria]
MANNTVYNTESQECCGSSVQNKSNKLCCDGHSYENDNNKLGCCKGNGTSEVFIKDKGICCNGNVNQKSGRMRCLGKKAVNFPSQNSDLETCVNRTYNIKEEVCCNETGEVLKRPETDFYSRSVYICQDGLPIDANDYHEKVEIVNGAKAVFPKQLKRCGNEYFIKNYEKSGIQYHCCNSHLRRADIGKNVQCCGAELYDFDERICCNNTLLSMARPLKCCGNIFDYNKYTHDCCKGEVIPRNSSVCGTKGLKKSIVILPPGHDKACYISTKVDYETYSSRTHTCHEFNLYTNQEFEKLMENDVVYNIGHIADIKENKTRTGKNQKVFCPFVECTNSNESSRVECRKRNELRFFVYEVRQSPGMSSFKAVITYPPKHAGNTVSLRTNYNCDACFEQYASYRLFTNRLYTNRRTKRFRRKLRFSDQDYLVKEGSDFHCTIDPYAKKQPRKGL